MPGNSTFLQQKQKMHHQGKYLYRLPGNTEIVSGRGDCLKGIIPGSFSFAPFIALGEQDICSILANDETRQTPTEFEKSLPTVECSGHTAAPPENRNDRLQFSSYAASVARIKEYLAKCNPEGKVVFSRRMKIGFPGDIKRVFLSLCRQYPDAFVFCFSTPESGCWIGASPELLLQKKDGKLHTMALAGTRPSDTPPSTLWDRKNIHEQKIVVSYIHKMLSDSGLKVWLGETFTKKAGPIEHICTLIEASLPMSDPELSFPMSQFICRFSPTPALCGSESREELGLINQLEDSPREFYGGWCGPTGIDSDFSYFVNLRSAKLSADGKEAVLFVGGGITIASDPQAEWEETERKATTLLLNFNKF